LTGVATRIAPPVAVALSIIAGLTVSGRSDADAAPAPRAPEAAAPARRAPAGRLVGTNRLIVHLDRASAADVGAAASSAGLHVSGTRRLSGSSTVVVTLPERLHGEALDAAIAAVESEPGVVAVEPVRRLYASFVPNDPYYSDQWSLRAVSGSNYGANAAPAWDITTGSSSTVVAIVDTGITDHPDLEGRVLPGYDFVSDPDTANDGDGRDADPHDPGDWITSDEAAPGATFAGCTTSDSSWHGTHVAGIVAATGNNATGIAGMDWSTKILPVRALGKCGGDDADVIDAIRWAAGIDVAGAPHNSTPADVINVSLGGSAAACGIAMQQAITDAIAAGSVVVTAAGNDGEPASQNEPGNCVGVINVAATGKFGERASYSNYGSAVTLTAPGGGDYDWGIRSTVNHGDTSPTYATYRNYQGTSMAAPHVAGAISLLLALVPTLTISQIRAVLTGSATPFPSSGTYSSCVGMCGAGILNVQAALIAAGNLRPPDAPTDLEATAAPNSITLTWNPPSDTGGTDIVDYLLQRSSNNGAYWSTVRDSVSASTGATITGLTNGRAYTFRVAAVNRVTSGLWSVTASATPATTPGRTRSLRGRRGDQQVSLSWSKPATDGGAAIERYSVEESTDGVQWNEASVVTAPTTSAVVTGLTNGTRYRFRVSAVNRAGAGTRSPTISVTPLTVPGAPGNVDGTPGNRSVGLSWLLPITDGGTKITRYIVQRSRDGGASWSTLPRGTSLSPSQRVRYLENGREYLFRVAARNKVGRGPWSIPFSVRPRTVPSAPRNVVPAAGDSQVLLTWTAPQSNGGADITSYRLEQSSDGLTWTPSGSTPDSTTLTFTVTSLTNGTSYRFRVTAVNAAGSGAFSSTVFATPHA
jgi:serine protease